MLIFSTASLRELAIKSLSQALSEGITFLTTDSTLARYPGPVRKV